MSKSFGRNEMESFLGRSPLDDGRNSRSSLTGMLRLDRLKKPRGKHNLDTMSPAEAAAHLTQKNEVSQSIDKTSRYRTNRVLEHHQLAAELLQSESSKHNKVRGGNESDSEESLGEGHLDSTRRSRTVPKEMYKKASPLAIVQNKARSLYASASSEDENEDRVRLDHETPAESSDDEALSRRQKRQRRIPGAELAVTLLDPDTPTHQPSSTQQQENSLHGCNHTRKPENTSGSSETSSEAPESNSSEDSSDSGDESSFIEIRPQYIPRKRRELERSYDHVMEANEIRSRLKEERSQNRKLESRAMLAQQLASSVPNNDQDDIEESYGASNLIPDDGNVSDDDLIALHRKAWEIREMERLLTSLEQEREKESRRLAYERRQKLTDEQCLQEDIQSGRYVQPGKNDANKGTSMGRYYHRGAYYMDEEEWDETDVRHKSSEYAKAATRDDKRDKFILPGTRDHENTFRFARHTK